ncbi:Cytochrome c biogenesis ATP-binding export protein CcmA [Gammaproteobacteria bacterium]|nr:heme ABC exporter ATP-binding protein CcmA [Gammaproteobacteria bacterium]QOJ31584.1 MAG: heme ABC exporter ATP-binding protein CcmA [Gammaproteobacteria bacterium]CAG0944929.1 Cytochrome c biogenesis ATP-binding export protein CcmA [Gammaproteobacteria bacterium]
MLAALDLTLWRGATCLFDGLSFEVAAGTALLLRGANGTGKTSLLRVLAGLTQPERGSIRWRGEGRPGALRGLAAYSGHSSALNADLTVKQNLTFYGRLMGWQGNLGSLLDPLGLAAFRDLEVRHLSAGQRRRGGLARLLMSDCPVWLLDEPFTNLDAEGRRLVETRIDQHLGAGGLAVIAVHDTMTLATASVATLRMGMD